MMVFTEHLVEANRALWAAMAGHPFVLGLAHGTLPDGALPAWGQQDRIFVMQERRVVAALRGHGLPSRLDGLLADLDRGLVLEAEALPGRPPSTASRPRSSPGRSAWATLLASVRRLRRRPGGPTPLAAERADLDTWTAVAERSPGDSAYPAWIQHWSGQAFRGFVSTLGRGRDELAGTPSPALGGRLGVGFTGAARFELAFWERCWSGQAGRAEPAPVPPRATQPGAPAGPSHRARDRHRQPGPDAVSRLAGAGLSVPARLGAAVRPGRRPSGRPRHPGPPGRPGPGHLPPGTDFLLRTATTGEFAEVLAALLPCRWGSSELGRALAAAGLPAEPRYRVWGRFGGPWTG